MKQFPQGLPARLQAGSVWHHSPYNHVLRTKEPDTVIHWMSVEVNWKKERMGGGSRCTPKTKTQSYDSDC